MTTYYAERDLSKNNKEVVFAGSKTRLEWLGEADQQTLVNIGAVRIVASPPLETLAGWKTRGSRLAAGGIRTIEEFLGATDEKISKLMKVKPVTVKKWRRQLLAWQSQPAAGRKGK